MMKGYRGGCIKMSEQLQAVVAIVQPIVQPMDDANIINNIHSASNDLGDRIERSIDAQTDSIEKDFKAIDGSLERINTSIEGNNKALKDIGEQLKANITLFRFLVGTAVIAVGLQVWDRLF